MAESFASVKYRLDYARAVQVSADGVSLRRLFSLLVGSARSSSSLINLANCSTPLEETRGWMVHTE